MGYNLFIKSIGLYNSHRAIIMNVHRLVTISIGNYNGAIHIPYRSIG